MLLRNLFFVLPILLLASCVTVQNYQIPVNHPAVASFSQPTTIVIINRFDFASLHISNQKKLDVTKEGALAGVRYAGGQLGQLTNVKVINLADSNHLELNTDPVDVITSKYHADHVLTLDKFDAGYESDNFQKTKDDQGNTLKTSDFNLRVMVNYTLYNKNGTVNKQYSAIVNDFKTTKNVAGSLVADVFGPAVKGNPDQVNEASVHATKEALRDYAAYVTTLDKGLYIDGALKDAVNLMVADRLDEAEPILRSIVDNGETKMAAKAAYDLSVLYEAKGDMTRSEDMAKISLQKDNTVTTRMLLAGIKVAPSP